jgi:hypothetical protein
MAHWLKAPLKAVGFSGLRYWSSASHAGDDNSETRTRKKLPTGPVGGEIQKFFIRPPFGISGEMIRELTVRYVEQRFPDWRT